MISNSSWRARQELIRHANVRITSKLLLTSALRRREIESARAWHLEPVFIDFETLDLRIERSCRHDYTVDILGGAKALNYASDYRNVDGIIFPATRRVVANEGDYQPVKGPVLVAIDMKEINLL